MCSSTSVNGVIGYPAKKRQPAPTIASAIASDPSMKTRRHQLDSRSATMGSSYL